MGLHARPAALIAQTAQQFQADIVIITDNKQANAKSILDILCLAIPYKAIITIQIRGHDAREAMEHIHTLFEHLVDKKDRMII
jgi:phosphocarrier protein